MGNKEEMAVAMMVITSALTLGKSVIQPEQILPMVFVTPTTEMSREAWARENPRLRAIWKVFEGLLGLDFLFPDLPTVGR